MEKAVRLALRLEDNEYFKCYFPEYKNTNAYSATGVMIHGDVFAFSLSEMYTEPSYWAMFGGSFFGDWTPKKYIVVNSVCGLTPSDWSNAGYAGTKVQYGRFNFFATAGTEIFTGTGRCRNSGVGGGRELYATCTFLLGRLFPV